MKELVGVEGQQDRKINAVVLFPNVHAKSGTLCNYIFLSWVGVAYTHPTICSSSKINYFRPPHPIPIMIVLMTCPVQSEEWDPCTTLRRQSSAHPAPVKKSILLLYSQMELLSSSSFVYWSLSTLLSLCQSIRRGQYQGYCPLLIDWHSTGLWIREHGLKKRLYGFPNLSLVFITIKACNDISHCWTK